MKGTRSAQGQCSIHASSYYPTIIFVTWNECHLYPPSSMLVLMSVFPFLWTSGQQHSFSFWGYAVVMLMVRGHSRQPWKPYSRFVNFAGPAQPCKLVTAWETAVIFCVGLHWGLILYSQQSSLAVRSEEQPWTQPHSIPLNNAFIDRI